MRAERALAWELVADVEAIAPRIAEPLLVLGQQVEVVYLAVRAHIAVGDEDEVTVALLGDRSVVRHPGTHKGWARGVARREGGIRALHQRVGLGERQIPVRGIERVAVDERGEPRTRVRVDLVGPCWAVGV